jgi:hypothetical protein
MTKRTEIIVLVIGVLLSPAVWAKETVPPPPENKVVELPYDTPIRLQLRRFTASSLSRLSPSMPLLST